MKRLYKLIGLKLILTCLKVAIISFLFSCNNNDSPYNLSSGYQDTVSSTVLVYMVGQNDLVEALNYNIRMMTEGMRNAPYGGNWLIYTDFSETPELYKLTRDEAGNVTRSLVRDYKNQFSTDPDVMQEVLNDAFTRFPADQYGVIFSSHADGWFRAYNVPSKRAFGQENDGETAYNMNIPDMARALNQVPHLNYILFDACLMGTVEVAYELRNAADYFLASPANVLSYGVPYQNTVPQLLRMTENDYRMILNQYYTFYQKYSGTMSAVRLSEMENLAASFRNLMHTETAIQRANSINRATMQAFEPSQPLYDFGQLAESLGVGQNEATAAIQKALSEAIFYKVYTKYSALNVATQKYYNELRHCCGLSSYIPYNEDYKEEENNPEEEQEEDPQEEKEEPIQENLDRTLKYYKEMAWFQASGWEYTKYFK